jgi:hypothetical protein
MGEESRTRHSGVQISGVSLTDARFGEIDLTRASFWRVRMRGAWIGEVEIDGDVSGLRINGVEVAPLIEAELDRRHPVRATMRPTQRPRRSELLVATTADLPAGGATLTPGPRRRRPREGEAPPCR